MKVILKQDIPKIGRKFEVKEVSDGYAGNYLLPRGLAERATKKREAELTAKQEEIQEAARMQEEELLNSLEALKGVTVSIKAKANEQGHLFKGLYPADIGAVLKEQAQVPFTEEHITLSEPIKETGTHEIPVKVRGEESSFMLQVEAE